MSSRHVARYSISNGLAGCYMPDSVSEPLEFATRRELVDTIKAELEHNGFPKSLVRKAGVRQVWRAIMRHGSSSMHFSIYHRGYVISFHGLTRAEFEEGASRD